MDRLPANCANSCIYDEKRKDYYTNIYSVDVKGTGAYTPYFQGCDPGVSFISSYDTDNDIGITVVSNFGCDVWKLRRNIYSEITQQK